MAYKIGDTVRVHAAWEIDGKVEFKRRPALIIDKIGDDHYCVLFYSKNSTDDPNVPGIWVDEPDWIRTMRLDHESYLNCKNIVVLKNYFIYELMGNAGEEFLMEVQQVIDDNNIEMP